MWDRVAPERAELYCTSLICTIREHGEGVKMKNNYEKRGDVTVIYLKLKGRVDLETTIDTNDFDLADSLNGSWFAWFNPRTKSFYVLCNIRVDGFKKKVPMQRWLMGVHEGKIVDHINGNSLDNRKSVNLRNITVAENNQNLNKLKSNNKSGYRGVNWNKRKSKWEARITVNKIKKRLGYFDKVDDAAVVVKEARAKYMPYSQEALSS